MTIQELLQSVLNHYKTNNLFIIRGVYGLKVYQDTWVPFNSGSNQCMLGAIAATYEVPVVRDEFTAEGNLLTSLAAYMNLSLTQLISMELGFENMGKKDRFLHHTIEDIDETYYELGKQFRKNAMQMGIYKKTIADTLEELR